MRSRASGALKAAADLFTVLFNEHSRQCGEIIITSRRGKGKGGWVSGLRKTDRGRPSVNCLIFISVPSENDVSIR